MAEGILRAVEAYSEPQLVNLASGREASIREVVEHLKEITGYGGRITWDAARPDGQ